jgi:hypothetical protein
MENVTLAKKEMHHQLTMTILAVMGIGQSVGIVLEEYYVISVILL